MASANDPRRDPEAVIADIEQAFRKAGFKARVMKTPDDPITAVVGYHVSATGKRRQVIATLEADGPCRGLISRPYRGEEGDDVVEPERAEFFNVWNAVVGVGDHVVESAISYAILVQPADPGAELDEIRRAMERIADPVRNAGVFGVPRSPQLASLANAMMRVLERLERLERLEATSG